MEQEQIGIITFRLDKVEEKIESSINQINSKLDKLLDMQSEYRTEIALEKQHRQQIQERVRELEIKLANLDKTSVNLQVGLAEKWGPGALSGAVVAVVGLILQIVIGV